VLLVREVRAPTEEEQLRCVLTLLEERGVGRALDRVELNCHAKVGLPLALRPLGASLVGRGGGEGVLEAGEAGLRGRARLVKRRLRRGDVVLLRVIGVVVAREARRNEAAIGGLADALLDILHERSAVERLGERSTDVHVVERWTANVEAVVEGARSANVEDLCLQIRVALNGTEVGRADAGD